MFSTQIDDEILAPLIASSRLSTYAPSRLTREDVSCIMIKDDVVCWTELFGKRLISTNGAVEVVANKTSNKLVDSPTVFSTENFAEEIPLIAFSSFVLICLCNALLD